MAIYTIVDEGYEVEIVRSARKIALRYAGKFSLEMDGESASYTQIMQALRNEKSIWTCLYAEGNSDWIYKIEKHKGSK